MIDTEVERSKTQSWAAVLMDQQFHREPAKYSEVQLLKCQLVGSAEQSNRQAIGKVAKLLIVGEPTRTTMYMNDPQGARTDSHCETSPRTALETIWH